MEFRKRHVKGWITPGGCNYYLGVGSGDLLFGILGFSNPDYGSYDLILKADTTPAEWAFSTELLLYALKSKEVQQLLSDRFNREIKNVYSMCFSRNPIISRYRKFAELKTKNEKRVNKKVATNQIKVNVRAKIARDLKSGKIQKQP